MMRQVSQKLKEKDKHDLSILALLTFGVGYSLSSGAILCTAECLAASMASAH